MEAKVYNFDNNVERYRALAEKYVDKGDYIRALSFLHTANTIKPSYSVLTDIADIYSEMGLYEISNNYWFKYIDIAPKEKVSVAYEELAINFFYLNNLLASSYYFQKKIATDGFISREGLDQEIIDYFSEVTNGRGAYHIAYPFEVADYSSVLKEAKRSLVVGDFEGAVKFYEKIPEGCKQYKEGLNELAVAYFLEGNTEKAIETARKSVKNGEDILSCCNLASMYKYTNDIEKSQYYYQRALTYTPKTTEEHFKIATVSLEQGESGLAIKHLEKVLLEREYDINVRYLYAIALINDGNYNLALEVLNELRIIVPSDLMIKYYTKLSEKLADEEARKQAEKLLPLAYIDDIPQTERKLRIKKIKEISEFDQKKRASYLKKEKYREYFKWGLTSGDRAVSKICVFTLSEGDSACQKILFDSLIQTDVSSDVKRIILFIIIMSGYKRRFGIVSHNFYLQIKPKKLMCEKDPSGMVFFSSYALCVSYMAFVGANFMDKIATKTDKVYNKFRGTETASLFTTEEFASLIALEIKAPGISEKQIAEIFSVKKSNLKKLKQLYEGNENEGNRHR